MCSLLNTNGGRKQKHARRVEWWKERDEERIAVKVDFGREWSGSRDVS